MRLIYIVLLTLAGSLIVLLLIGTIFGLVRSGSTGPLFRLGRTVRTEQTIIIENQNNDIRIFSDIGRLRIPLSNSSVLILSIAFPYLHNDTVFTEELAVKISDFKQIAHDYFSSLPEDRIIHIDEEAAKTEILRHFNASLRLGRIEALYFSDMMIIAP